MSLEIELKGLLSKIQTREEAISFWIEFADHLQGYTLVLAENGPSQDMPWPARCDFDGGCHLRSVFSSGQLFLLNNDILSAMSTGPMTFPLDYSIGFDSNVASYLRAWKKGFAKPLVSSLGACFTLLRNGEFNWDLLPYLMESSDALRRGENLTEIFETVFASKWFGAADKDRFAATGCVVPNRSDMELIAQAQTALAEWDKTLSRGIHLESKEHFDLIYTALLRVVQLQIEFPAINCAERKFKLLVRFLDGELNCMLILVLRAAMELFCVGNTFRPLQKVVNVSPRLLANLRNVTLDFMHIEYRRQFTSMGAHGLLVPYFMTFDQGLADLFDLFPQKSCVFGNELHRPLFFHAENFEATVQERFPNAFREVLEVFTVGAAHRRAMRRKDMKERMAVQIARIEAEINRLVER